MLRKVLVLIAAVALFAIVPAVMLAANNEKSLVVVLVDRGAIHSAHEGVEYARSVHTLASVLDPDRRYAFVAMDEPLNFVGPVEISQWEYAAANDAVQSLIGSRGLPQPGGHLEALVEVHNFIGQQIGNTGSEVYFLSGGGSVNDYGNLADRISPALSRFQGSGWPIHTIALPGSTAGELEFLGRVSGISNGRVFHLAGDDGIKGVADHMLKVGSAGTMSKLAGTVLRSGDLLSSRLRVVPGTQHVTVTMFKDADSAGDLRVETPSGLEISRTDADSFLIEESPHVVVMRLFEPEAGPWLIETVGVTGRASIWQNAENRYTVGHDIGNFAPVNEKILVVAHVLDNNEHAFVAGTKLFGTVTGPDGNARMYPLNDEGLLGDRRAADGYHSVTIPEFTEMGNYDLSLTMAWPEYNHSISTSASFAVQAFPTLRYEAADSFELAKGERVKVGALSIHVQDEPYPVALDAISIDATWPAAGQGQVDLVPQVDFKDDTTWIYDVYLTPSEYGQHRFVFWLQTGYAGQGFTHGTGSVVFQLDDPTVIETPAPQTPAVPAEVPIWVTALIIAGVAVGGVILLALLVILAYWVTRTQPKGCLFNDRNELVVDFGKLNRPFMLALFSRDKIGGEEIGAPAFNGVDFVFSHSGMEIAQRGGGTLLRVNNQPLVDSAPVADRSWIGANGKLYTFIASESPVFVEAGEVSAD